MNMDFSTSYPHAVHCSGICPHPGVYYTAFQCRPRRTGAAKKKIFISYHKFTVGSNVKENTDSILFI